MFGRQYSYRFGRCTIYYDNQGNLLKHAKIVLFNETYLYNGVGFLVREIRANPKALQKSLLRMRWDVV